MRSSPQLLSWKIEVELGGLCGIYLGCSSSENRAFCCMMDMDRSKERIIEDKATNVLCSGLLSTRRYMLLGSTKNEIDSINSARTLPGIIGFEAEARRSAMRRRTNTKWNPSPPGGNSMILCDLLAGIHI